MSSAVRDSVIRMALASMAADRESSMTQSQRQWVIDRLHDTAPLTPRECWRLESPLLEWVAKRQPRILDIVQAQFEDRGCHGHDA
jgi:hypothetical protein